VDLNVRCVDCRRILTDEVSRRLERGPVCRQKKGIVVVVLDKAKSPRKAERRRRGIAAAEQLELDLEEAS